MAIPSIVLIVSIAAATTPQAPRQICAIDMGSNTFRRIVGSFENGRYEQKSIERKSLGVGDDVGRHGRISDAKLAEIEETLIGFARSCQNEGVTRVVAIGTAAFRDAPNGATIITLAAKHSISMELRLSFENRSLRTGWLARSRGYAVIDNGSRSIELVSSEDARGNTWSSTWATGSHAGHSSQRLRIRTRQCRRSRPLETGAAPAAFMRGKKANWSRVWGDGRRPVRPG